jgi:hypothetical protein
MPKPLKIDRALSRAELLEVAVNIETRIMNGDTREEIMDALAYTFDQYEEARKFLLDLKSEEVRGRSREHTYVEYVMEQRATIRALDKLAKDLDSKSQYNALVGAYRLRSDLLDKIIDRGHDFGFIKKTPERKEIVAGLIIGDMSAEDLKKEIVSHGKLTRELLSKFGDGGFLELPDSPTHYGDPEFIRPDPSDVVADGEELDDEEDLDEELRRKAKAEALAPRKKKSKKSPKR